LGYGCGIFNTDPFNNGEYNMKESDDFLRQRLDPSNFEAMTATDAQMDSKLESEVQAAMQAEIGRIREFAKAHPDHEFAKANQHVLEAPAETWTGIGNVDMSGFIWWAVGGGLAFPSLAPLGFLFGAKGGPDWSVGVFAAVIGGSFILDPKKIANSPEFKLEKTPIGWVKKGPCNFNLSGGGLGPAGGVSMNFYSSTGVYWGAFGGYAPAFGGGSVSGQAELVWQGF
jgi:hypothetical protein